MSFTKVTNTGIASTGTVLLQNLDVIGIATAGFGVSTVDVFTTGITTFANATDSTSTTTGSVIVSGGVGIAGSLNVGGSVSVGGTLTYEDVTNVDSVGLITARNGIVVGSGITLSKDGDVFATGIATVATLKATTGIVTSLTIGSLITSSAVGVGTTITQAKLDVFQEGTRSAGYLFIAKAGLDVGRRAYGLYPPSTDSADAPFVWNTGNSHSFEVDNVDRLRIHHSGRIGIGTDNPAADLHISSGSNTEIRIADTTTTPSYARIIYNNDADNADALVFEVDGGNDISGSNIRFRADGSEKLRINSSGRLLINSTTSRNIGGSVTRLVQVEGTAGESGIAIARNSNNASPPTLDLAKSRSGSVGGNTIVQDGDKLGIVNFVGADGTDLQTSAAQISGEVDGTPGADDMPGRLVFKTTADGNSSPTERLRIGSNGLLTVTTTGSDSGIRLVDGSQSSGSPNLEIISKRVDSNVNTAFSSNIFLGRNRTDQKIVTNTFLGTVAFGGNHTDGTEGNISYAAAITARSSGDFNSKSDMPTDLIFTTGTSGTDRDGEAAGSSNVGTERLRITKNGHVLIGGTDEVTDTKVRIVGNMAQSNTDTGTGATLKTYVLSRSYTMSTSGTNVLTFDNWGTSAFDISVFRRDNQSPAGAQLSKVYLAFHGSGTNITQATLAQENKVIRGSIHSVSYSISENNNTATLTATGDNTGGETQDLTFYILARGNATGTIVVA